MNADALTIPLSFVPTISTTTDTPKIPTPLEISIQYRRRGWMPVPVPYREKGPKIKKWQQSRLSEAQLCEYFNSTPQNIGIILGEASNGLVDIDLDCPETVKLANAFLPDTTAIFGRASKRRSHWLYICTPIKTLKFEDVDGAMLVEIRSTGNQTVFPGSVHTSGEQITWDIGGNPTTISPDELEKHVKRLAAAALLAKHWAAEGSRQNAAMCLAGGLLRGGWTKDDTSNFIRVVAHAAGDSEADKRINVVDGTADNLAEGKATTGWTSLGELIGRKVVERAMKWLGCIAPPSQLAGKYRMTDIDNARMLVDQHCKDILHCESFPSKNHLASYDGKRWVPDISNHTQELAKKIHEFWYGEAAKSNTETAMEMYYWAQTTASKRGIDAMVALAKSDARIQATMDQMDQQPCLMNCLNGELDLSTGILHPHRPDSRLMKTTNVEYLPDAKCLTFENLLDIVFDHDKELIGYLQRILGYSLTAFVKEKCGFWFHGPADSLKTTILNLHFKNLGDYGTLLQPDTMLASRTEGEGVERDLAQLHGRRAAICSEMEAGFRIAEARFKRMVGGDHLKGRHLYAMPFTFKPVSKLIFATNNMPTISGNDKATQQRIRIVPFKCAVPKNLLVDSTFELLEAERAGIFAWCVRGAMDWLQNGLQSPKAAEEATQDFLSEMDLLAQFIEEAFVTIKDDPSDVKLTSEYVEVAQFYAEYAAWVLARGEKPLRQRQLTQTLQDGKFISDHRKCGNARRFGYFGLRIRHDYRSVIHQRDF